MRDMINSFHICLYIYVIFYTGARVVMQWCVFVANSVADVGVSSFAICVNPFEAGNTLLCSWKYEFTTSM